MSGRTHGVVSTYKSGCRCDDCRRANRDAQRAQRAKGIASVHGLSGYKNYGCRCAVCVAAGSVDNKASAENLRDGTWEPSHGTQQRGVLGCRCDACKPVWTANLERIHEKNRVEQASSLARSGKWHDRWTSEEAEMVRRLSSEGVSSYDIALELGRTANAVRQYLHRLRHA